ncbi:MAG TPA: DNA-deoxyinosine glycosylase, partial [Burkholderiaceae bacterium]
MLAESAPAQRLHGLAPVYANSARWLLLGSFPGEASLRAQQYYGHPQNQFWRLLGAVLGEDLQALGYAQRLDRLRARQVAVWDVIATTVRAGSLDSAIRAPEGSDLLGLMAQLPELEVVAFNGGAAAKLGRK